MKLGATITQRNGPIGCVDTSDYHRSFEHHTFCSDTRSLTSNLGIPNDSSIGQLVASVVYAAHLSVQPQPNIDLRKQFEPLLTTTLQCFDQ